MYIANIVKKNDVLNEHEKMQYEYHKDEKNNNTFPHSTDMIHELAVC
jgi:hypothetical protein